MTNDDGKGEYDDDTRLSSDLTDVSAVNRLGTVSDQGLTATKLWANLLVRILFSLETISPDNRI